MVASPPSYNHIVKLRKYVRVAHTLLSVSGGQLQLSATTILNAIGTGFDVQRVTIFGGRLFGVGCTKTSTGAVMPMILRLEFPSLGLDYSMQDDSNVGGMCVIEFRYPLASRPVIAGTSADVLYEIEAASPSAATGDEGLVILELDLEMTFGVGISTFAHRIRRRPDVVDTDDAAGQTVVDALSSSFSRLGGSALESPEATSH